MYIRCADCYACSRIWSFNQKRVVCGNCGRKYTVSVERPEEVSLEAISKFALSNGIDAPLAGSVLLGFMSIERARAIRDNKQKPAMDSVSRALDEALRFKDEPKPVRGPTSSSVEADYDPGFERAVARGHLTAWGARQRGDREALIRRISDRHELPRRLASMVADNQVNLRAAIAATSAAARPPEARGSFMPGRQTWLTGALAVALVLAVGWGLANRRAALELASDPPRFDPPTATSQTAPAIQAQLSASTQVHRNESGELVEIIGPDPWSVLRVFCAEGAPQFRREALDIAPSVPSVASARLGIYRDRDSPVSALAIRIRRDRGSGRWVVGNGRGPIPSISAQSTPAGETETSARPRS